MGGNRKLKRSGVTSLGQEYDTDGDGHAEDFDGAHEEVGHGDVSLDGERGEQSEARQDDGVVDGDADAATIVQLLDVHLTRLVR